MKNLAPRNSIIEPKESILLVLNLLFLLTIKILFLMYAKPLPDEAYYWLWSKNIALSYFDHPPLIAWFQALLSFFSNNNYFLIRALPIFSLVAVLTILIVWQRFIARRFDFAESLQTVVLFLSFPIFSIFFSISFPDYLLITLLFGTSFCLFLYFERNDNGKIAVYYWYLAVLLFSLALLTKYNAVLFGLGVLAYFLYSKKEIGGPSYGHIIAATFIIALIQTPVLFWNISNELASFSFHLNERLDQSNGFTIILKNAFGFLLGVLLAFSPIFLFNLKTNIFFKNYRGDSKKFIAISKFVLFFSAIFCLFLCLFTTVLYYWLTPAIILLTPFLTDIIRSKIWQYLHIFYGLLISLFLLINVSFFPIRAFFGDVDRETAILFGWKRIVEIVDKEKHASGTEKVVFSDYRLGSLYIFHSGDFEADVVMEERKTQFDIWREEGHVFEEKALIIADNDFPIGKKISSRFQKIEFVRDIEIRIGNTLVKKYQVFLGKNA